MPDRMRVAVVGAGTMGNGIAHAFAQHGHPVRLIDVAEAQLQKARTTIADNLERQVKKSVITAGQRDATLSNLSLSIAREDAADCGIIIEAVPENRALKAEILRSIDGVSSDAILASNTSSISITDLAAVVSRPDRFIGMHFMNPVPLMTLVELIRGQATSPESMTIASELCAQLGKTALEAADYPGFIANRILMPMINEAIFAYMEGVGTAEAIDGVMKLGMNHPMGPLTLADFIGLDVCLAILNVLHEGLGDPKYRPCPLLRRMVAAGHLGRKSGRGFYSYT